jgi:hypothetical protein
MNEGRLKLVLYKQKEAIERVVPALRRAEIRTLVPAYSLFSRDTSSWANPTESLAN